MYFIVGSVLNFCLNSFIFIPCIILSPSSIYSFIVNSSVCSSCIVIFLLILFSCMFFIYSSILFVFEYLFLFKYECADVPSPMYCFCFQQFVLCLDSYVFFEKFDISYWLYPFSFNSFTTVQYIILSVSSSGNCNLFSFINFSIIVPSSIISEYTDICSGFFCIIFSNVCFTSSTACVGSPIIRSTFIFLNPHFLA